MNPFTYLAYYRDCQIKNNKYTNLNGATVRVLDNFFEANDQIDRELELLQPPINKTFPNDFLSSMQYDNKERKLVPKVVLGSFAGNELAILRVHDAFRKYNYYSYSFAEIFNKDFLSNHTFRLSNVVSHNIIELYKIKINPSEQVGGDSQFSEGVIYIERQN